MFFQADHVVRLFADFGQGLGRRDGNRQNERLRRAHACGAQGRSDGRARGDSVVDDDRDAVLDVDGRAIAEIAPPSALDFGELLIADLFEFGFVDRQVTDDVLVTNNNGSRAVDDGAHCQFRPPRHADFAHQDEAQRRTERGRLSTRPAYVATGDATVDQTSRQGLITLTRVLSARTSAELAEPVEVDPARDELAFYPLIYWPIVASQPQPRPEARARLAAYMKYGGTVVFDTRDALTARPGGPPTQEGLWLRALLQSVDVPELEPTPQDHVLTKTFYLLDRIVGRTAIGQTWVEALPALDPNDRVHRPVRAGDSVSPIIIVSDDLAAAWASDAEDRPLYPLIPGGARQRELALRSGINLVMYTLTGNYKADQVHAKDIIERLTR